LSSAGKSHYARMMARRTLLVVEDDDDLRRMYHTTLALAGFEVSDAANGMEALRRLDGWAAPDLIVLDLMMPGISGHAVAQEVAAQAHLRHIPVLIVTGSAENVDYLDVACVMRKPVTAEGLIEAVRQCLGSAPPPTEA
jgi:CheY-like chemotaxis protein